MKNGGKGKRRSQRELFWPYLRESETVGHRGKIENRKRVYKRDGQKKRRIERDREKGKEREKRGWRTQ